MPEGIQRTEPRPRPCNLIDESTRMAVLPAAVPELLAALADEELDFERLAEILSRFPSIAARVLFLANSAWAAPVSEITSLEKACVKLGLSLVRSISISIAIAAPFDPARCPAFSSRRFWTSAMLVSEGSVMLSGESSRFADEDRGSVATAALLHNLGLLWMADNLSERVNRVFETHAADATTSLPALLRDHCGADHAQIGGCLAEAWGFPGSIAAAMQFHLDPAYDGPYWEYALLTGCASTLVHALQEGGDGAVPADEQRLQRLGIETSRQEAIYSALVQRHQKVEELVQVLFG